MIPLISSIIKIENEPYNLNKHKYFRPKEKMGKLVLEHDLIEKEADDVYYVTGFFHVSFNDGKKLDRRFSTRMEKVNGKW